MGLAYSEGNQSLGKIWTAIGQWRPDHNSCNAWSGLNYRTVIWRYRYYSRCCLL